MCRPRPSSPALKVGITSPPPFLLERILVERRRRWEEAELARMKAARKGAEKQQVEGEGTRNPSRRIAATLPSLPEGWCWTSVVDAIGDVQLGRPARSPKDRSVVRNIGKTDYLASGIANVFEDRLDLGITGIVMEMSLYVTRKRSANAMSCSSGDILGLNERFFSHAWLPWGGRAGLVQRGSRAVPCFQTITLIRFRLPISVPCRRPSYALIVRSRRGCRQDFTSLNDQPKNDA